MKYNFISIMKNKSSVEKLKKQIDVLEQQYNQNPSNSLKEDITYLKKKRNRYFGNIK